MGFSGNYDLENVEGGVSQDGVVSVCRNYPYESSTEYAEHVKNRKIRIRPNMSTIL